MLVFSIKFCCSAVAPARGRGLKYASSLLNRIVLRRPRKGAWIEISVNPYSSFSSSRRPRKGAWIEILEALPGK